MNPTHGSFQFLSVVFIKKLYAQVETHCDNLRILGVRVDRAIHLLQNTSWNYLAAGTSIACRWTF